MTKLRTAIVIDYQNLHLTGHGLFKKDVPKHEALISPGGYAKNLIQVRKTAMEPKLSSPTWTYIGGFRVSGTTSRAMLETLHKSPNGKKILW